MGAARLGAAPTPPPPGAFESYIKGLLAESAATQATFLEAAIDGVPGFDQARLALWDVRYEQGDHAAALAAVKPVAGASAVRRPGAVAGRHLPTRSEGLRRRGRDPHAPRRSEGAADHDAAARASRAGAQQPRHRPAAAWCVGRCGSATYFLTRATDADPEAVDYQFNLGYAYLLDRNYKAALYWLREAVRREVTDADAHYLLALALQAEGSGVEAAREKDLARQLSSRYEEPEREPVGRTCRAGLERLRTDLELSQTVRTTQAIPTRRSAASWSSRRFISIAAGGCSSRSRTARRWSSSREPSISRPYQAAAHLLIGRIHLRAGRPEDAVEALKISIWSEDSAPAHVVLARAFLSMKNSRLGAATSCRRRSKIDPASSRGPAAARHHQVDAAHGRRNRTDKGYRTVAPIQDVRAVHDPKERRSAW